MEELLKELKGIIKLLDEEKKALTQDDGKRIVKIVATKNEYIDRLSRFKGIDVENDEEAMKLIEEINSKQELNLLLTKQALSFQNSVLESISKNANKLANTYSARGNMENNNRVNLIDQSI
ncbi:hypothetical protein ACTNDY_05720 [Tissierellaceae bacterium HCP3S3_D8]